MKKIILIIAIAVFLFSAHKLITIFSEYREGNKEYDALIEDVIIEEKIEVQSGETIEPKVVYKIDFDKLLSTNPDTIGWIRFDNPEKINYPIVMTTDNDKYLTTTFEGKQNSAGTIFADAGGTNDFSDKNTFIYGHNMKNGSMFGQLRQYKKEAFCKENPYFYIYTPDGREITYQVFAVCVVEDTSASYDKTYANDAEYEEYIKHIKSIALYNVDVEVTADSQIISLSTCTNVTDTQRLLVHGVKILEEMIGE